MKNIFFLLTAIITLVSCRTDFQPDSTLTYEGYWSSDEAVKANHTGIYAKFRDYAPTLWRLGEARSDMWGGKTIESPFDVNLYTNNISVTNAPFTNWAGLYTMILYTNDFIKNAPPVAGNTAEKNHMMGQVHGLRAYLYYTLLKTYGDVQIVTDPLQSVPDVSTLNKKRESKQNVAAQIKADLAKSLDYFGNDSSLWKVNNAYWSKTATLALKGEAYLFFGKVLGEGTAAYTEAKTALSQITGFSLAPTFADLWGVANEKNKEFIFALDYQQNQANNFINGYTTGAFKDVSILFDKDGNSQKNIILSGGNRFGPSEKLIKLFHNDPADTRGASTFMYLYGDNNGGKGYPTYDPTKYRAAMMIKFYGDIVDGTRQSFANYPIYRYADVLLMLAEAKNQLGEDPSAEINAVRKRAYGANFAGKEFVSGSKDANTKAILDERLKEFVGEGKRWWDLQRAGDNWIFQEVPSMNASPISGNAKKIYLPISQGMIDLDPNNLTQTDGY